MTWFGLVVAYYSPYPIGFFVTTFAFAAYVLARLGRGRTTRAATPAAALADRQARHDVRMFAHPFMRTRCWPAPAIALAAGLVGYFLVLRAQVFTGDALSHVAFTGALAALAFGVDPRLGLFAATIVVALRDRRRSARAGRADDVVIGSVFAWILGLGAFFLTLYTTSRSAANGAAGVTVLFGSIFGLSGGQAPLAAVDRRRSCVARAAHRPAAAVRQRRRGGGRRARVPVRVLGIAFLALVGATAAEATQAVGALLLLGLLAAPAGAALRLTDRPYRGLGSVGGARGRGRCGPGSR